jgi:hypothetical protein
MAMQNLEIRGGNPHPLSIYFQQSPKTGEWVGWATDDHVSRGHATAANAIERLQFNFKKSQGTASIFPSYFDGQAPSRTRNGVATLSHSLNSAPAKSQQQAKLFPLASSRLVRCAQPPTEATVMVAAAAIADVIAGRCAADEAITKAIRAARPDVRAIGVDLNSIRWTDPKTELRVTFDTPATVRDALLALSHGGTPEPFRFHLGRSARVTRGYFERESRIVIFRRVPGLRSDRNGTSPWTSAKWPLACHDRFRCSRPAMPEY